MRETYLSVAAIPQEYGTRSLLCDRNKFCGKVFPVSDVFAAKTRKQRLSLCHKNLTRANRSFLYDADYIAGSPQWFEKYPQDFPFSEQAPCENESE
jgi:hypothetical protein